MEMMQKGLSGFRRFLDVMETVPEIQDNPDAVELTNVKGHVCYENVSFHYSDDETEVLSHVSIDIPAGKSVALVGPSGGGKTTICSLLPRFYDVTGGKITVFPHAEKSSKPDWCCAAGCLSVFRFHSRKYRLRKTGCF